MENFKPKSAKKGFLKGLIYGLIPHTFCILFVLFSVAGVTAGTVLFKKFLLIPNIFPILIGLSFVFAIISAIFYLKRNQSLSFSGAKSKWRYLSILFGTTIFVNMLLFYIVLPNIAKLNSKYSNLALVGSNNLAIVTIAVDLPCSGHIPLVMDELKKLDGVKTIESRLPNLFVISYDSQKLSESQILSIDIFKEFNALLKTE